MDAKIDYAKIYSPSKLNMFLECPKCYHFYYLDPIYSKMKSDLKKLPDNIWSFHTLGKAVHNAITLFYHSPIEERTKGSLKEFLKETWQSEVMPNKKPPLGKWGGFESIEREREAYHQALQMLANFWEMAELEIKPAYLPTRDFWRSIEDYKKLIVPLTSEFDISGKFDLVIAEDDDSLRIVDFKTGKREKDDYFQLRFYKILAELRFKKPVEKASFYFLRAGNKKEFDLTGETIEEIRKEMLARIREIKAKRIFEPRPSKLCKFCLFKSFCPEKEKVSEIVEGVKEGDYPDDLPF